MQNQMGQIAKALQESPLGVLPSNTVTDPRAELKSISLVPPPKTPPLSAPKPKENPELNPHQQLIPYPFRLQKDKFQALDNPTGRADHFIYRIDIVDSLCDNFPIENNSLSSNPTPYSDLVVASLSPSLTPFRDSDSLLEETVTLLSHSDDSLPDYETFFFDIEEKSSGSTTSHSDHSLPDYEAFCFDVDHIKEKSSGSTTSHSDLSLLEYESFYLDLSIDTLPPTDRSDSHHEEFVDELAHIISPPEYDHFYFDIEVDPGELTRFLIENSSRVYSKRSHILPLNDFSHISFVSDLLLTDSSKIETFLSFHFGNEDKVFDPGILLIDGGVSFARKAPHLLNDNFKIDKRHILSEISLKIVPSVSFHPKDKGIRGDFDPFLEIPSDESKVHIEVLSVLWGNRLSIPDGLPLLSR
ncbi:hypothetical protein Tco_0500513 [Tanacetum coccineum]